MITAFTTPGYAGPDRQARQHADHQFRWRRSACATASTSVSGAAARTERICCACNARVRRRGVRTGALAESQKSPWSPELSVRLTSGGWQPRARRALADASQGIVSGFHHAHADHGEGFCTFNGLVIAAEAMRAQGEIRSVAVLDMDLHYGNGTAALAASRPWLRNVSLYGNDYQGNTAYPELRHATA
jgi:acetoin utilization deacetylase AcuC-like enzyme